VVELKDLSVGDNVLLYKRGCKCGSCGKVHKIVMIQSDTWEETWLILRHGRSVIEMLAIEETLKYLTKT